MPLTSFTASRKKEKSELGSERDGDGIGLIMAIFSFRLATATACRSPRLPPPKKRKSELGNERDGDGIGLIMAIFSFRLATATACRSPLYRLPKKEKSELGNERDGDGIGLIMAIFSFRLAMAAARRSSRLSEGIRDYPGPASRLSVQMWSRKPGMARETLDVANPCALALAVPLGRGTRLPSGHLDECGTIRCVGQSLVCEVRDV